MKMALLSNLGCKINMENDEKDSINYMEYSGTLRGSLYGRLRGL